MTADGGDEWARGLPSFGRPPVFEVAVAVYFLEMPGLSTVELVRLHEVWSDEFPVIVEQPPMPPRAGPGVPMQLQILSRPAIRIWFLSRDEALLVQVQSDRLIFNWRSRGPAHDQYPRYSFLREKFSSIWENFCSSNNARGWGEVQPVQAEVSFLNRIPLQIGESPADYLSFLGAAHFDDGPRFPFNFQAGFDPARVGLDNDADGSIVVTAGTDNDDVATVNLEISGRVSAVHAEPGLVTPHLDLAHRYGVLMFDAIGTPYAHERWARK